MELRRIFMERKNNGAKSKMEKKNKWNDKQDEAASLLHNATSSIQCSFQIPRCSSSW